MLELRQLLLLCEAILSSNLARDCYIRHINANLICLQSNKVMFVTFMPKGARCSKGFLIPSRPKPKGDNSHLTWYGGSFSVRCSLYRDSYATPQKGVAWSGWNRHRPVPSC